LKEIARFTFKTLLVVINRNVLIFVN